MQTMNNKKYTITVGIPAYNEEKNIGKLLHAVFSQTGENFVLEKVIVVSDCSTDKTNEVIQSIKDKRIQLLVNSKRMGQSSSQNKIFSLASSDIVILLEADTLPSTKYYIEKLILHFDNTETGLIQGNELPLKTRTFIGKIFETQFYSFYKPAISDMYVRSLLCSGRGGRAFRKSLYEKLRWPNNVPEDTYAFLWCKTNTISTYFEKDAVCFFKLPENVRDFVHERKKIKSGMSSLEKYYSAKQVKMVYLRSYLFNLKVFFNYIQNPYELFLYLCIWTYVHLQKVHMFTDNWKTTETTKSLSYEKS